MPDLLGTDLFTSGHLAAFLDQIDDWQLISPKMHIPLKDLVNVGIGGGAGIWRASTLPLTVAREAHITVCSLHHREDQTVGKLRVPPVSQYLCLVTKISAM